MKETNVYLCPQPLDQKSGQKIQTVQFLGDETKLPFKNHCIIQINQTNVTFQVAKIVKGKNLPRKKEHCFELRQSVIILVIRQDSPSPKYGEGPRAYV